MGNVMWRQVLVLTGLVLGLAGLPGPTGAQSPKDEPGPAVGAVIPEFAGVDQLGRRQTLQTIAGPEGAMVVFYRSADW